MKIGVGRRLPDIVYGRKRGTFSRTFRPFSSSTSAIERCVSAVWWSQKSQYAPPA